MRRHAKPTSGSFVLPRTALAGLIPIAIALIAVAVTLAGGSDQEPGAAESAQVIVATVHPSATPQTLTAASATATVPTVASVAAATATPGSADNRANCAVVRNTGYLSLVEREWFLSNCTPATETPARAAAAPTVVVSQAASSSALAPAPAPAPPPAATGSYVSGAAPGPVADRLVVQRLGIDASVHTSVVGANGVMGDPDGAYDVIWYDFSAHEGLGGYPGQGGNAVLGGHVDYHPNLLAVFWYLRDAVPGDVIDYYTYDGRHLVYTVQWVQAASPEAQFNSYVEQSGSDIMTLVTCDGAFNSVTRHYDGRSVIRAIRTA